jgi:hypothetical protein
MPKDIIDPELKHWKEMETTAVIEIASIDLKLTE